MRDEGCDGQLQLSFYGTRDVAHNWAHTTFLFGLWVSSVARVAMQFCSRRLCLMKRRRDENEVRTQCGCLGTGY